MKTFTKVALISSAGFAVVALTGLFTVRFIRNELDNLDNAVPSADYGIIN